MKARCVIADDGRFHMIRGHLGCNDQPRQLDVSRVAIGDTEEGGDRLRVADLEEFADLWPPAIVIVKGTQQGTHGSGFRGLTLDLTVEDFAALRGADGLEGAFGRANPQAGKDEHKTNDCTCGTTLLVENGLPHITNLSHVVIYFKFNLN